MTTGTSSQHYTLTLHDATPTARRPAVNPFKRLVRWLYRSAIDGRFVSRKYAERHPDTTYRERLP